MKKLFLLLLLVSKVHAYENVQLKHSPEFVFQSVLKIMAIEKDSHISFPTIVLEKETNLKEFQKDVEPQWGMKPDFITNVFVAALNKIYLLDEKRYYEENGRCIDDSLAHELVHFVQVKYRNIPIEYFDDKIGRASCRERVYVLV